MLIIGLTGGIGTGKSEIAHILQELGAVVIDADQVGHEVYQPQSEAWQEVVKSFGEEVLQPGGEIDRKRLGAIVFQDPQARVILNNIMHPRIFRTVAERVEEFRRQNVDVVVVEAALLIEAGWDSLTDEVWMTHSPEKVVVERLRHRNGLSEDAIRNRIRSQMSFEERSQYAHVVVDNSGDMEELGARVRNLWGSRVKGRVK